MTTLRNLKPHYAERKGKSGPVIRIPADSEFVDRLSVAICREKHSGHDGMGCVYGRIDAETLIRVAGESS
jgi:hypothetical protein